MLRHINDPEHPLTLEQLSVVTPDLIEVQGSNVTVRFTPTIPNCTMATLIGLMIRVKLHRSLPASFKVDVFIEEGKHDQQTEINKQLNDKERVFAALENNNLLSKILGLTVTRGREQGPLQGGERHRGLPEALQNRGLTES